MKAPGSAADDLSVCSMAIGYEFAAHLGLVLLLLLGPGWRGAVKLLSTVPTVDWVLLGFGESIKG